jgi:hypothetical protein
VKLHGAECELVGRGDTLHMHRIVPIYPGFEYISGVEVSHLRIGPDNRIRAVVGRVLESGVEQDRKSVV